MNNNLFILTAFVTMIVINHLALIWLPWYFIMPITAVMAYIFDLSPKLGALLGFASLFMVWMTLSLLIDVSNDFILSDRIGELFGGLSSLVLWVITGLIGGIGGCIGGWFGGLLTEIASAWQI